MKILFRPQIESGTRTFQKQNNHKFIMQVLGKLCFIIKK